MGRGRTIGEGPLASMPRRACRGEWLVPPHALTSIWVFEPDESSVISRHQLHPNFTCPVVDVPCVCPVSSRGCRRNTIDIPETQQGRLLTGDLLMVSIQLSNTPFFAGKQCEEDWRGFLILPCSSISLIRRYLGIF
jgi:hypothetical protein